MFSEEKDRNRLHWLKAVFSNALVLAAVSTSTAGIAQIMKLYVFDEKEETFSQFFRIVSSFAPRIVLGFFIIAGLIILFVTVLALHRTATGLKNEITSAFIKALDNSSFNPRRLEKDSHEYKLDSDALGRTP